MSTVLSMFRGDDRVFTFTLTEDGEAMDLTGAAIAWTARVRANDEVAVISKDTTDGIAIDVDPTTGIAVLVIDAEDTEAFTGRRELVWDLEVRRGGKTRTVLAGLLRVALDVSRPDSPA